MTVEELLADFQKQKQTVLAQIKEGEATILVLKEKFYKLDGGIQALQLLSGSNSSPVAIPPNRPKGPIPVTGPSTGTTKKVST
jgi:hypothetical protein